MPSLLKQSFTSALLVAMISTAGYALPVLPLSEDAGLERLTRSAYKTDFFKLANQYRIQTDKIFCGPTTAAIVLNALRYGTPKAPLIEMPEAFLDQMPMVSGKKFDPRIRAYTPENFLNAAAQKIKPLSRVYAEPLDDKRDPGLQLEQLKVILENAHDTKVTKGVVGTKETAFNGKEPRALPKADADKAIAALKKNLQEKDNYVIVNYARGVLKQAGGGHISPVGAYDEKSDSFLVLDTNPGAAPWIWVDSADLVNAMNTFDTVENRGFLLVSEK